MSNILQTTFHRRSPLHKRELSAEKRYQKSYCQVHQQKKVKYFAILQKIKINLCSDCAIKLSKKGIEVIDIKENQENQSYNRFKSKSKSKSPKKTQKKTPKKQMLKPLFQQKQFESNIFDSIESLQTSPKKENLKNKNQFDQEQLDHLIKEIQEILEKYNQKRGDIRNQKQDLKLNFIETKTNIQQIYLNAIQQLQDQKDKIIESLTEQYNQNQEFTTLLEQQYSNDHESMELIQKDLKDQYKDIINNLDNTQTNHILLSYKEALNQNKQILSSKNQKIIYSDIYSSYMLNNIFKKDVVNIAIFKNKENFISFENNKDTRRQFKLQIQEEQQQKKINKILKNGHHQKNKTQKFSPIKKLRT